MDYGNYLQSMVKKYDQITKKGFFIYRVESQFETAEFLVTLNGKKKTKNNFCVLTKYDKERLGKILPREFSLEYLINDLKKERVNKPTFLRYGFDSVMRGKLEDQQKMIINKVKEAFNKITPFNRPKSYDNQITPKALTDLLNDKPYEIFYKDPDEPLDH